MKKLSKAFLVVWLQIFKPIEPKRKLNKISSFVNKFSVGGI